MLIARGPWGLAAPQGPGPQDLPRGSREGRRRQDQSHHASQGAGQLGQPQPWASAPTWGQLGDTSAVTEFSIGTAVRGMPETRQKPNSSNHICRHFSADHCST